MRNRRERRLFCLLLCLLLALAGCEMGQGEAGPEILRGRYLEEELPLPDNLENVYDLTQLEDGSIWLRGTTVTAEAGTSHLVWSSSDGGESWQVRSYPWLEGLEETIIEYEWDYISVGGILSPDEVLLTAVHRPDGLYGDENAVLYRGGGEGIEALDYSLMSDRDTVPFGVLAVRQGLLVGHYMYVALLDNDTGQEVRRFASDTGPILWGLFTAWEDMLAVMQQQSIALYKISTGELLAELPFVSADAPGNMMEAVGQTALAFQADGSALFYANATGIYRVLLDGSVTEKMLDGELVSIGMSSYSVHSLVRQENGSFLVLCRGWDGASGWYSLFRYDYDPNVPSVPGRELNIYSLCDDQAVRYAAITMQLGDPDLKVNFEVGLRDDSVTVADALRTLSTQLLAGSGPDILVLDGMPVESYIVQGALLDLSGLLDKRIDAGELLHTVAGTYRRDRALYGVPTRFAVPLLHGAQIGGITDLRGLADWVERQGESGLLLIPDNAMERFYDMLAPGWFGADGSLAVQRFRQDLIDIARLVEEPDPNLYYEYSLNLGALYLKGDAVAANLGWMETFGDADGPYTLIAETGEGEVVLFPAGGVFRADSVLGVNAATAQPELARQFVELMLSPEIQGYDFGLPVNVAAAEEMIAGLSSNEAYYSYTIVDPETGQYVDIDFETDRPDTETLQAVAVMVCGAETPSAVNLVVKQMITEETLAYFRGEATLDDTVAALKTKLDLYLAEMG